MRFLFLTLIISTFGTVGLPAQEGKSIPPGAKIYIAPMDNGFDIAIAGALQKKKVPVLVVVDREKADFELKGLNKEERNSVWRGLLLNQYGSKQDASVQLVNINSGVMAWAYNYRMASGSAQSAGESVAKHLKKRIEKGM